MKPVPPPPPVPPPAGPVGPVGPPTIATGYAKIGPESCAGPAISRPHGHPIYLHGGAGLGFDQDARLAEAGDIRRRPRRACPAESNGWHLIHIWLRKETRDAASDADNFTPIDDDVAHVNVEPPGPVAPVLPVGPVAPPPVAPVKPVGPVNAPAPVAPVAPVGPVGPLTPVAPPEGPVGPPTTTIGAAVMGAGELFTTVMGMWVLVRRTRRRASIASADAGL